MPVDGDLKAFLQSAATRTDAYLKEYLETLKECPRQLSEAMAYSLFGPGKRIRRSAGAFVLQGGRRGAFRHRHAGGGGD